MVVTEITNSMIQWVTIASCMNAISNVLYTDHLLKESDRYHPIPIVNSLYNYLLVGNSENYNLLAKQRYLAEKVGEQCDIDKVSTDPRSITQMLSQIIQILVFAKYEHLSDEFMEYTIRNAPNDKGLIINLLNDAIRSVTNKNKDEYIAKLDPVAIDSIHQDISQPSFSLPRSRRSD